MFLLPFWQHICIALYTTEEADKHQCINSLWRKALPLYFTRSENTSQWISDLRPSQLHPLRLDSFDTLSLSSAVAVPSQELAVQPHCWLLLCSWALWCLPGYRRALSQPQPLRGAGELLSAAGGCELWAGGCEQLCELPSTAGGCALQCPRPSSPSRTHSPQLQICTVICDAGWSPCCVIWHAGTRHTALGQVNPAFKAIEVPL